MKLLITHWPHGRSRPWILISPFQLQAPHKPRSFKHQCVLELLGFGFGFGGLVWGGVFCLVFFGFGFGVFWLGFFFRLLGFGGFWACLVWFWFVLGFFFMVVWGFFPKPFFNRKIFLAMPVQAFFLLLSRADPAQKYPSSGSDQNI